MKNKLFYKRLCIVFVISLFFAGNAFAGGFPTDNHMHVESRYMVAGMKTCGFTFSQEPDENADTTLGTGIMSVCYEPAFVRCAKPEKNTGRSPVGPIVPLRYDERINVGISFLKRGIFIS